MSVLVKASEVIDCLGRGGEPVTLGYVHSALGMPKSSVHWLLGDLAHSGMGRRVDDGRYSPTSPSALLRRGHAVQTFELRGIAGGSTRRLKDEVLRRSWRGRKRSACSWGDRLTNRWWNYAEVDAPADE